MNGKRYVFVIVVKDKAEICKMESTPRENSVSEQGELSGAALRRGKAGIGHRSGARYFHSRRVGKNSQESQRRCRNCNNRHQNDGRVHRFVDNPELLADRGGSDDQR